MPGDKRKQAQCCIAIAGGQSQYTGRRLRAQDSKPGAQKRSRALKRIRQVLRRYRGPRRSPGQGGTRIGGIGARHSRGVWALDIHLLFFKNLDRFRCCELRGQYDARPPSVVVVGVCSVQPPGSRLAAGSRRASRLATGRCPVSLISTAARSTFSGPGAPGSLCALYLHLHMVASFCFWVSAEAERRAAPFGVWHLVQLGLCCLAAARCRQCAFGLPAREAQMGSASPASASEI
jgi:hypothetical protein